MYDSVGKGERRQCLISVLHLIYKIIFFTVIAPSFELSVTAHGKGYFYLYQIITGVSYTGVAKTIQVLIYWLSELELVYVQPSPK